MKRRDFSLKLPWLKGMVLLCSAGYGPTQGSPYHDDEHNAFYALDFDKPWRGNIMPSVPILVVADGKIAVVGKNKKHILGYHVSIDHGGGYQTLYAHLRDKPEVSGQIKQGQVLDFLGETGKAFGPHLHFQLFYRDHCVEDVPQSCPEPISGHTRIQPGKWYISNNTVIKERRQCRH